MRLLSIGLLFSLGLCHVGFSAEKKSGKWTVLEGGGAINIATRYTDRSDFEYPIETDRVFLVYSCATKVGNFPVSLTLHPILYWTDGDKFLSQAPYDSATRSYKIEAGSFQHIQMSYSQNVYARTVLCTLQVKAEIIGYPAENAKWDPLTTFEPSGSPSSVGPYEVLKTLDGIRITFPKTPICANASVLRISLSSTEGKDAIDVDGKDIYVDEYSDRFTYTTGFKVAANVATLSANVAGRKGCQGRIELTTTGLAIK